MLDSFISSTALEASVFFLTKDKGGDGPRYPQRQPDLYGDGQVFLLLFRCPRQDVLRPLLDLLYQVSNFPFSLSAPRRSLIVLNHNFSILVPFRRSATVNHPL